MYLYTKQRKNKKTNYKDAMITCTNHPLHDNMYTYTYLYRQTNRNKDGQVVQRDTETSDTTERVDKQEEEEEEEEQMTSRADAWGCTWGHTWES